MLCEDRLPIHSVLCGGSLCFVKIDFPFTVCGVAIHCALCRQTSHSQCVVWLFTPLCVDLLPIPHESF